MRLGYAIARGEKPPSHLLVPVYPITKETVNDYTGWQGPVPAPFSKPWPSLQPQWQSENTSP